MLLLSCRDVSLSRQVRLLHPRIPVYVVPRGNGLYMVGATMIETGSAGPITARSMMELLNAAYALPPAFGEAELVETGVGQIGRASGRERGCPDAEVSEVADA